MISYKNFVIILLKIVLSKEATVIRLILFSLHDIKQGGQKYELADDFFLSVSVYHV